MRRSVLLIAAFTSLLLVIGCSAFAIWRNAMGAQRRVASMHTAHLQAGSALAGIRANVFLTAVLTRDYLLDLDPGHAPRYLEQFAAIRTSTADSFRILEAAAPNEAEKRALDQLRQEVTLYWDRTAIILDWTPEQKTQRRTDFLRQRVRRREDIVNLASQVERLMTENFTREQERIRKADQDFQSSLGWITGIALLLGIGIAGITLARMTVLERNSEAAATELRRLSGQLRTAQEEERTRLSRELHDEVGQMLTGLRMELASMARLQSDAGTEVLLRISHAKGIVEQTLGIVRDIAMLLRPSMLDDLGLTPALQWLAKEMSRSSGIEVRSEIDPSLDSLPEAHRTCIYRIVQEALTNAVKHAGSREVVVTLIDDGHWVVGRIVDDGRGFQSESNQRSGLGLVGMKERVLELGGDLQIASAPGRGTRIEIRLPRPNQPGESEKAHDTNSAGGRPRNRENRIETSA